MHTTPHGVLYIYTYIAKLVGYCTLASLPAVLETFPGSITVSDSLYEIADVLKTDQGIVLYLWHFEEKQLHFLSLL